MNSMTPTEDERKAEGRRDFLKLVFVVGWGSMIAAAASVFRYLLYVPPPSGAEGNMQLAWPRVRIANVKSSQSSKPLAFNYPLVNTPNVLVKLGAKVQNGVGPDLDIVAYSIICQHLGCYVGFQAPNTSPPCNPSFRTSVSEGYCCCHGGEYDFAQGAKVIGGPPERPLPAVRLEYDSGTGDVYAVGMEPPTIFGHGPPGTTDPDLVLKYDLEGGQPVTQDTVFASGY